MGRISQFFWAVNADRFPTKQEQEHHYTHMDFSRENIKIIKEYRSALKKQMEAEDGSEWISIEDAVSNETEDGK